MRNHPSPAAELASAPLPTHHDGAMTIPPPDGSRDRRIEDPTNLWLIHPAARSLLSSCVSAGVSANVVSVAGLLLGIVAAGCYAHWTQPLWVLAGLALSIAWLVADGLDGMIARATGTASATGRFLDGVCDHGVFIIIYVTLATTLGDGVSWALAIGAGACHIIQSALYEGERARFHRRARGTALAARAEVPAGSPWLLRGYDRLAALPGRLGLPFEQLLARSPQPGLLGARYAARAVPAMRVQSLLSANMRVWLIAAACLLGNPRLFWSAEIVLLSLVAAAGLILHRRAERLFLQSTIAARGEWAPALPTIPTRDR